MHKSDTVQTQIRALIRPGAAFAGASPCDIGGTVYASAVTYLYPFTICRIILALRPCCSHPTIYVGRLFPACEEVGFTARNLRGFKCIALYLQCILALKRRIADQQYTCGLSLVSFGATIDTLTKK